MNVFKQYSQYYDLLYKDKNYKKETDYIIGLIKELKPKTKEILNLGCGTGAHDRHLIRNGFNVTGLDISKDMITIAKTKNLNKIKKDGKLDYHVMDIRNFKLPNKYDMVISLFHVMSYQNTNEDIRNTFNCVSNHLNKGGIFIFDCWYGPGVLTDLPTRRIKIIEDDNLKIIRISEPEITTNKSIVAVNFDINLIDKKKKDFIQFTEKHSMRYLFDSEIEEFAVNSQFRVLHCYDWLTKKTPSINTWNALFILEKI